MGPPPPGAAPVVGPPPVGMAPPPVAAVPVVGLTPPFGAVPVVGLTPPVGVVPVEAADVPPAAVPAAPAEAVPAVVAAPAAIVPVEGAVPGAPAAAVVPGVTPVALLPVVPVAAQRNTAGRAVVWGVLAAVLISAAWVGGYLWSDRNQEVGRPVTAAQGAAATSPRSTPSASTVDPGVPLDPTTGEFDDQGFTPTDPLPSTAPTVPITPVPVSGQATCEAPPGVDAAGAAQTYEVGRAFDGALDTAWRCAGDASGQTVTFDLGQPVLLTSVGLVPGYDKIDPVDGADRFAQGRTVVRARWVFDDGSTLEVAPNGARGMQTTPVQVTTQTVQLQILETRPGTTVTDNAGVEWGAVDATAVSEVAFAGLTY
ncbi:hypothetical protein GCM10009818_29850 [Nakamurella flavida]